MISTFIECVLVAFAARKWTRVFIFAFKNKLLVMEVKYFFLLIRGFIYRFLLIFHYFELFIIIFGTSSVRLTCFNH